MAKKLKFYAVKVGYSRGVFSSWDQTRKLVEGYTNARHKSFLTMEAAEHWMGYPCGSLKLDRPIDLHSEVSSASNVNQGASSTYTGSMYTGTNASSHTGTNASHHTTSPQSASDIRVDTSFNNGRTAVFIRFHPHDLQSVHCYLPGNYLVSGQLLAIWGALSLLKTQESLQPSYTLETPSRYILNCIGPWGDVWESRFNGKNEPFREAKIVQLIRQEIKYLQEKGVAVCMEKAPAETVLVSGGHAPQDIHPKYLELLKYPKGSPDLTVSDSMCELDEDTKYVYVNGTVVPAGAGYGVFFDDTRNFCSNYFAIDAIGAELQGVYAALRLIYSTTPAKSYQNYTLVCKHPECLAYLNDQSKPIDHTNSAVHNQILGQITHVRERLESREIDVEFTQQQDEFGLPGNRMAESFATCGADGNDKCMYFGDFLDVD